MKKKYKSPITEVTGLIMESLLEKTSPGVSDKPVDLDGPFDAKSNDIDGDNGGNGWGINWNDWE